MEINIHRNYSKNQAVIIIAAIILYWMLFIALHEILAVAPIPLIILPVVASSWFWGSKRGLVAGVLVVASSIFAVWIFNIHHGNPLVEVLFLVISFILGSAAGWVRKLYDLEKSHAAMLAEEQGKLLQEIEERKAKDRLLKRRYAFEHLIYSISNRFINVSAENIEEVFNSSLQAVGQFLEMDRAYFFREDSVTGEIKNHYEWRSQGANKDLPKIFRVDLKTWPLFKQKLHEYKIICMQDAEALPPEEFRQKEYLREYGIRSAIVVPVVFNNTLIGFLGFDSILPKNFSEDTPEMLKIISDIFANATLQKQKNQEILASEERFRLLVQHSADVISVIDCEGQILYESEASGRILGYRAGERNGMPLFRFLHSDEVPKVKGIISMLQNKKVSVLGPQYLRVLHSDGSWVYLEVMFTDQIDNPAIKGIVLNARDFTQHFALQDALRNSRDFLNTILNGAGDPLFVKDSGQKFIIVNDAFCRLTGYKREEIIDKTAHQLFTDEEADNFFVKGERALKEAESIDYEASFTDKQGNKHIVSTHLSTFQENSGKKYIIANLRDETKRKELEQEINNALMKEKELSEMKSKFISMVSHEYRTPLTAILSSAELLELFGLDMTGQERQEHLDGIKKSVQYLTSMLNEVLLLNRAESQRIEFSPSSFELAAFCKEILKNFVNNPKCKIEMKADFASRTVIMDEKLLGHIITNLLSNAAKYSLDGAVVRFNIYGFENSIDFEVIDKGIGIPVENQKRLFEPFYRANNALNIPGSGLGLSIVKYCTDLHNGEISFESKPGEGTKFWVSLPEGARKT